MDINKKIAEELEIKVWQVEAVVKLVDEGNTIPFIARYRKEQHGALNDEQLRNLHERLIYLRNLEEKKKERKNNRHRRLGTGGKSIGNAGELPSI